MVELAIDRHAFARRGRRLEYFTIAWNSLEGIVAVVAGIFAGSISLVGFGMDSFVEVTSGTALLWRLSLDAEEQHRERKEKVTLRIVRACFLSLATYVGFEAVRNLVEKKAT
jgi:divalent metal cation (Fe/Co/Zn/Cd) transporter